MLSALSQGVRDTLVDTATTLACGHVNVGGFYKSTPTHVEPLLADATGVLDRVKRDVPEAELVVTRGRGWGKIVSDRASIQSAIAGIELATEPSFARLLQLRQGDLKDLAHPNTLLLFEQQAKALDVKLGDAVTISTQTSRGIANTLDCRVVAIAADVGLLSSLQVFVPAASLRELYALDGDVTGVVQVHLKPAFVERADAIARRLQKDLERAGYELLDPEPQAYIIKLSLLAREDWTGQRLDVTTWSEELSFVSWTFAALQGLSFVLMVVVMTIMVAGLMNALWITIRERTREIGTLRAIGMQRTRVTWLFLLEGASMGLLGASLGAMLGVGMTALINRAQLPVPLGLQLFLMRDTLSLSLDASTIVRALAIITVIAAIATLYPARRAASRKPVDAMAQFE